MKSKIKLDGILAFLLLAVTIWADYVIYGTKILFKYKISICIMISIIALLMLVLTFKKMKKTALWIRRAFMVIFIILFTVANTLYFAKYDSFVKNVTKEVDKNVEKISVIVPADSSISSIEDLKGKKVGYQDATDKDNAKYVKKQLNKNVKKIKYAAENNYLTLSQQLLNKDIDALIISNSFIVTLTENDESFPTKIKYVETYNRKVKKTEKEHSGANLDLTKDVFTVLVSGMDETGTPDHNGRCDVVMLLLVNPNTNHIDMISFPRDSYIPNPALGGGNDKLTHTGNNGVENTMLALENVIGFDINFYVKVNFSTVVEMVDAIGGVTVDVPVAFTEQNSQRSFAPEDLISLNAGVQTVNGEEALAFARHRKTASVGDIGRTKAQQQVIAAMIKKVLTPEGALKVPSLLDIAGQYVVTNVSEEQLNDFVNYQLENLQSWSYSQMTLENGYSSMLTTASMGNVPLSCYVLASSDLDKVYQKYQMMLNPISFNEFSFDLNDLETNIDLGSRPVSEGVVDTNSDLSEYKSTEIEEPVEEVEIPEESKKEEVDKSVLNSAVAAASTIAADGYTEDSWNMFVTALANAQAVLENTAATQADVDAATLALNNAIAALKPVEPEIPVDPDTPENPDSGDKPAEQK